MRFLLRAIAISIAVLVLTVAGAIVAMSAISLTSVADVAQTVFGSIWYYPENSIVLMVVFVGGSLLSGLVGSLLFFPRRP